jgi:aminoglycoside phosphotransferase (APT) family kinase protein
VAEDACAGGRPRLSLVHGDFRNGNLMVGEDGLRAVLDWELAHLGDPMEDLGWLCVNSWRFGRHELPVGGFGTREQLFAGYVEAGGTLHADSVHYWEVFGTLKWGVICESMAMAYLRGAERNVERATIGRRASEAEIDLLCLLAPQAAQVA